MPVHLRSRLPAENEARIEIIPLIDIMFFLLAAFMLVSLSMVNLQSVKVDLPTATTATPDTQNNLVSLSIDPAGVAYLNQAPVGPNELALALQSLHQTNPAVRVLIRGDRQALHGAVLHVLDTVRNAGIQHVAFETRPGQPATDLSHPAQAGPAAN